MTAHRKWMQPEVAKKAIFCLNNYCLLHRGLEMGDSLFDFSGGHARRRVDETRLSPMTFVPSACMHCDVVASSLTRSC